MDLQVSLAFPEVVVLVIAYLIGRLLSEVAVIGFREWNFRRSYSMRNR